MNVLKLNKQPVNEVVLEVRFEKSLPDDAVFGIVYNQISTDFDKPIRLPINELPLQVIKDDPNLIYSPHHRFASSKEDLKNINISLGPRVLSISSNHYCGWHKFRSIVSDNFDKIISQLKITRISRIGLRYLNFIDNREDLFDNLNVSINLYGNKILTENTLIRTVFDEENGYKCVLQIANDVMLNSEIRGALIDIDSYQLKVGSTREIIQIIDQLHIIDKEKFFSLFKVEFLKYFEPIYEGK